MVSLQIVEKSDLKQGWGEEEGVKEESIKMDFFGLEKSTEKSYCYPRKEQISQKSSETMLQVI